MKQFFNLVVPMAGRGSRFTEQGYTDSKPFIDVEGKPMIQRVIENLNFELNPEFKTIILCQKSDYERYNFSIFQEIIGHNNIEIIQIDGITEGAACTLLLAEEFIDNDIPMLSFNTDQMIDYEVKETFDIMRKADGGIPCFWGDSTDWSYAKIDKDGYVTEVAEKKVISNNATAGYYYWSKGSDFVKYAKQMIAANDRVNNEFYVAPVYNYAIKDGKKIRITQVDKVYELGTPEYLENYLKRKKKKIALCFYGQVRNTSYLNEEYINWNSKEYNFEFDFFIHSWNDFDNSKLKINFKKKKFTNFEYFEQDFLEKTTKVTEANLSQDLGPIIVSYHLKKVNELREEYEKENNFAYDLILLIRPDFLLNKEKTCAHINELFKTNVHTLDKPVVSLRSGIEPERSTFVLRKDCTFIENRAGADKHARMFDLIFDGNLLDKIQFRYINGTHNLHPVIFYFFSFVILYNTISLEKYQFNRTSPLNIKPSLIKNNNEK